MFAPAAQDGQLGRESRLDSRAYNITANQPVQAHTDPGASDEITGIPQATTDVQISSVAVHDRASYTVREGRHPLHSAILAMAYVLLERIICSSFPRWFHADMAGHDERCGPGTDTWDTGPSIDRARIFGVCFRKERAPGWFSLH